MNHVLRVTACLAALWIGASAPASGDVRELRLGIVKHNVLDRYHREDSENIEVEVVWDSPAWLELIGAPRPYAMASINDDDYTSFAGLGLYWRYRLSPNWTFEPGFGYVIHNGEIDNPFPDGDPRNAGFGDDAVLLGSRDLFRTTLALERKLGPHFATQVYFEHLSHGQIIGAGRNQGLDEAGVRFAWRLKPE